LASSPRSSATSFCVVTKTGSSRNGLASFALLDLITSFLLAHCGGGQDEPECLGPSAERSGCFISAHALRQAAQMHGSRVSDGIAVTR
jgi:hypothetical protein